MNRQCLVASCVCGQVEIKAEGQPIATVICYCDDCQKAAARIEAMPGAAKFREPDGGTPLVAFRKDRVRCVRGRDRLMKLKLRENSPTNRQIAACCNSVIMLDFDDSKHWTDLYSARITENAPTTEMLICTKFATQPPDRQGSLPSYPDYPARFMIRILTAKLAMLFSR